MEIPQITHDYEAEIAKENLPVVIEFYAVWCPKCAMMKTVVERIAKRNKNILVFKKVDIDLAEETATHLGVEIVPTFVVYFHGEIMGYTSGVLSEQVLENRIFEMLEE